MSQAHDHGFPVWLIVLLFIFGLWPIAVALIVYNEVKDARCRKHTVQKEPPRQASFAPVFEEELTQNTNTRANVNEQSGSGAWQTENADERQKSPRVANAAGVAQCGGCGFNNQVVIGVHSVCDYCGNALLITPDAPPADAAPNPAPRPLGDSIKAAGVSAANAAERFFDDLF